MTLVAATPDELVYPGLNIIEAGVPAHLQRIVNNLLVGRQNIVLNVLVTETMVSPVTLQDERIHPGSFISIMPSVADFKISAVRQGECDISWTTAGWSTATLKLLVIG